MISRRTLLQSAAACGAGLLLPSAAFGREDRFRFVHFTDLHIEPELRAPEGVAMAVRKLLALNPRPDFVVIGGDCPMDWTSVTGQRAEAQFRLLEEALKPLEMPVYYTLGNHDVYGWARKDETEAKEPGYGKRRWEERIAKGPTYQSFDHGGWHFAILDSIELLPDHDWRSNIDDAQMQWLKTDLERVGPQRPIILITHVPVMTLYTQYTDGTTAPTSDTMILRNGNEVRQLFQKNNVKAVLQGHTHVVEECIYAGTRYITSGAICGNWWQGFRLGVHPEGFAVYDINGGDFTWQYVPYGWKAVRSAS